MENIGEILASNLMSFRKARGWTQEMLAEFAELSQNAIAQIENQRRWPARETISRIAKALGIKEFELFIPPDFVPKPTLEDAIKVIAEQHGLTVERAQKKKRRPK